MPSIYFVHKYNTTTMVPQRYLVQEVLNHRSNTMCFCLARVVAERRPSKNVQM